MKLDYTPHNMRDIEVKIVTKLFEMFEEAGWVPVDVDDGGEDLLPTPTWSETLAAIDSVEWSTLWIKKEGSSHTWVEFITGSGSDVVYNYPTWPKDFEALMERHADWVVTLLED